MCASEGVRDTTPYVVGLSIKARMWCDSILNKTGTRFRCLTGHLLTHFPSCLGLRPNTSVSHSIVKESLNCSSYLDHAKASAANGRLAFVFIASLPVGRVSAIAPVAFWSQPERQYSKPALCEVWNHCSSLVVVLFLFVLVFFTSFYSSHHTGFLIVSQQQ